MKDRNNCIKSEKYIYICILNEKEVRKRILLILLQGRRKNEKNKFSFIKITIVNFGIVNDGKYFKYLLYESQDSRK